MNTRKKIRSFPAVATLVAVLFFTFVLSSCHPAFKVRTVYAMDTMMTLTCQNEGVFDALEQTIVRMDKTLSVTDKNAAVYRLNHQKQADFEDEYVAFFRRALDLCAQTNGAFDITMYPVVRAWGFTTDDYRVPTEEELTGLLTRVGYEKVTVEGNIVRLAEGTEVDLGGVAKGYLGDVLRQECIRRGVTDAIFNLGGNVVCLGQKNGKPWRVGIAHPDGNGYLGILDATDTNIVTSGAYERYFEKDGVKYGHIFDPATGRPATGLVSVTVIGEDGMACDALSTALFVMGFEKACAFIVEHDVRAVLYRGDGKVYVTPSLDGVFTVDGRFEKGVIT